MEIGRCKPVTTITCVDISAHCRNAGQAVDLLDLILQCMIVVWKAWDGADADLRAPRRILKTPKRVLRGIRLPTTSFRRLVPSSRSRLPRNQKRNRLLGEGIIMLDRAGNLYVSVKGLETIELPDGYVVYLPDRAVFLNRTAAIVWELCDGENTVSEITALIRELFQLPVEPTAEVEVCIRSLLAERLIKVPDTPSRPKSFLRRLFRKIL